MGRLISLLLPEPYIEGLDTLIPKYGSRSEAIRVAVRGLIEDHKIMKHYVICNTKTPLSKRPHGTIF